MCEWKDTQLRPPKVWLGLELCVQHLWWAVRNIPAAENGCLVLRRDRRRHRCRVENARKKGLGRAGPLDGGRSSCPAVVRHHAGFHHVILGASGLGRRPSAPVVGVGRGISNCHLGGNVMRAMVLSGTGPGCAEWPAANSRSNNGNERSISLPR